MGPGRRGFIASALAVMAAATVGKAQVPDASETGPQPGPKQPGPTTPPPFGDKSLHDPPPRLDPSAIMKANQEKVKKDVGQMADLIQQLQKELDANDSKDVLSSTCSANPKRSKSLPSK